MQADGLGGGPDPASSLCWPPPPALQWFQQAGGAQRRVPVVLAPGPQEDRQPQHAECGGRRPGSREGPGLRPLPLGIQPSRLRPAGQQGQGMGWGSGIGDRPFCSRTFSVDTHAGVAQTSLDSGSGVQAGRPRAVIHSARRGNPRLRPSSPSSSPRANTRQMREGWARPAGSRKQHQPPVLALPLAGRPGRPGLPCGRLAGRAAQRGRGRRPVRSQRLRPWVLRASPRRTAVLPGRVLGRKLEREPVGASPSPPHVLAVGAAAGSDGLGHVLCSAAAARPHPSGSHRTETAEATSARWHPGGSAALVTPRRRRIGNRARLRPWPLTLWACPGQLRGGGGGSGAQHRPTPGWSAAGRAAA